MFSDCSGMQNWEAAQHSENAYSPVQPSGFSVRNVAKNSDSSPCAEVSEYLLPGALEEKGQRTVRPAAQAAGSDTLQSPAFPCPPANPNRTGFASSSWKDEYSGEKKTRDQSALWKNMMFESLGRLQGVGLTLHGSWETKFPASRIPESPGIKRPLSADHVFLQLPSAPGPAPRTLRMAKSHAKQSAASHKYLGTPSPPFSRRNWFSRLYAHWLYLLGTLGF